MATGKDLNKQFLRNIDETREKILKDGMAESKLSGNVQDVSGDNSAFVTTDDLDRFKAINALKNYLEFSTFKPDHTYEIFGAVIKEDGKDKVTTLYIREEDITKIADMADDFERLLGIRLPAQIHQLKTKYASSVIPGTTAKAPRAKLMVESESEYEEYLENFYQGLNQPKTENPDGIGRQPYTHEKIDYRTSDAVNQSYASEYYLRRFAKDKAQSLGGANNNGSQRRPNNRINDDDRLTVRESDDVEKTPLGRKIGSALNSFDTFFKNQALWKKVRVGEVGTLLLGGAIFVGVTNPAIGAAALYGGALVGGVVFISKKAGKAAKKKINEWLYGPVLEKEKKEEKEEQPEQQPPAPPVQEPPRQEPVPPVQQQAPNPVVIPEQLDQFLNEAGINMEQYRDIERRLSVAQAELAMMAPNTPECRAKIAEIAALKQQQRDQLLVIEGLMEEMLKDFNIQKNGGKSL